ncbi:MAG: hypothetical protein EZS28_013138 [Streblomastix strix]|uniref:Uncharacterized protein n=1 Tax=Streblomastix strix TaxID=222440 RepID=A0A5J4W9K4_9EUKA|nr:MAG: hypothetical protein EZS28_013138 [Streblomastix strix]
MEKDFIIVALQVKVEEVIKDIGNYRFIIVALPVDINIPEYSYLEENSEIHIDLNLYTGLMVTDELVLDMVDYFNQTIDILGLEMNQFDD